MDAGYDAGGRKVEADFTDPEELNRWPTRTPPRLGTDRTRRRAAWVRWRWPTRNPEEADYTIDPESRVGTHCVVERGYHVGSNVRVGDHAYPQHNCRLKDDGDVGSANEQDAPGRHDRETATYNRRGHQDARYTRIEEGCWIGPRSHLKAGCWAGARTLVESWGVVDADTDLPEDSRIGFNQLTKGYGSLDEGRNKARIEEHREADEAVIACHRTARDEGGTGISPDA